MYLKYGIEKNKPKCISYAWGLFKYFMYIMYIFTVLIFLKIFAAPLTEKV